MPRINEYFLNLRAAYLFAEIRRRTQAFADAHPAARIIDLGVGDVTRPLPPAVVRALHDAADDMARPETFKGYGPYVGYEWLRAEIAAQDFGSRGGAHRRRRRIRPLRGHGLSAGGRGERLPARAA